MRIILHASSTTGKWDPRGMRQGVVLLVLFWIYLFWAEHSFAAGPLDDPSTIQAFSHYDILVLLHIPKTGGTSLRAAIHNASKANGIEMQEFYDPRGRHNTFTPTHLPRIVYGQLARYPTFHSTYLPPNARFKYLSLIRNPISRVFSQYMHYKKMLNADQFFNETRNPCGFVLGKPSFSGNFGRFVACFPDHLGCYQWKSITGMADIHCTSPYHPSLSDEEVIAKGLEIVRQHFILLPTEYLDRSLEYIYCAMDFPYQPRTVPFLNDHGYKGHGGLDWESVQEVVHSLGLDQVLHAYALTTLFNANLARCRH